MFGRDVSVRIWQLAKNAKVLSSAEIEYKQRIYGNRPDDDLEEAVRIMEEKGWIRTEWLDEESWHWELTPEGLRYGIFLNRSWMYRRLYNPVKSDVRTVVIAVITAIIITVVTTLIMRLGGW